MTLFQPPQPNSKLRALFTKTDFLVEMSTTSWLYSQELAESGDDANAEIQSSLAALYAQQAQSLDLQNRSRLSECLEKLRGEEW